MNGWCCERHRTVTSSTCDTDYLGMSEVEARTLKNSRRLASLLFIEPIRTGADSAMALLELLNVR
jgi:hypothetical protein